MDNVENRLVRCFSSVFPELSEWEIRHASVESMPEWNSLAAVTLVAVLQEEFGIQVNLADLPSLASFAAVQDYVRHNYVAS
jgi:acyl carrier protein